MDPALLIGSEWLPNRAGGLNRYFHGLCSATGRAGIPATGVVTYVRHGQTGPIPLRAMAGEGAGLSARLAGARTLAREAIESGVALANPHFALYAWPWVRDLPSHVPLVVSFHGPWADEMLAERRTLTMRMKAAVARSMERAVYRRADRCLTLSRAFAEVLAQRYGVAESRIAVAPGGIDLDPYLAAPTRADARAQLSWPSDRPIVLCVRRLARRMGLDLLIEAAGILRASVRGLLVLIAGTGHAADELRAQVHALGLDDTVRFLGFVPDDDLPVAYAGADVTVMPSLSLEGFGLTLVESLASGTPAIGTPVGGIPEVLHGMPQCLTTAATSAALADRLLEALTRSDMLPTPEACRGYAMQYGWDAVWPIVLRAWRDAGAEVGPGGQL